MKKIALLLVLALVVQLVPVNTQTTWTVETKAATTLADETVIDETIIPDETLLNCIKDCVGKTPEEIITYGDVKNISTLRYPVATTADYEWKPIETLEGIEILTSLSSLNIEGHNVTDLTPLANVENLGALWANDNKISVMPDFSEKSMSAFYVKRNMLSYEDLYNNYPSGMLYAVEDSALSQVSATVETIAPEKYYQILDKSGNSYYPIILESSNIRSNRSYSIASVKIDGDDVTSKFELKNSNRAASVDSSGYDCPYIYVAVTEGDFLSTDVEHSIVATITDEYGETFTLNNTFVLETMKDAYEIIVEEPEYISTTGVIKTGITLNENKNFMTKSESISVSKVEFTGQDGTVYGKVTSGQSYTPYGIYDYRYSNNEIMYNCENILWTMVGSYDNVCQINYSAYGSSMWIYNELEPGFYDLIYTLSDGTTYTYKNAYEAVTRPIIYDIADTEVGMAQSSSIVTDQTSDYVSIYVYGWNISKDTVKPVFYNSKDEAITGDVAAVETDKWGGYFRIEKNDPDSEDWDITLYTNSNNVVETNYKKYDVKIETEEETIEEEAYIYRRNVFYQYFDQRDKSFTVYFTEKTDVDTTCTPSLSFTTYDWTISDYKAFATVESGTFTEEINSLTGQKEIKAKFILTDEQIQLVKDNEYSFYYQVEYKDTSGSEKISRNDYTMKDALGGCDVDDVPEKGIFAGYNTKVFYLPYWIGNVYSIEGTEDDYYFLSEEDLESLSVGKYAYSDVYGENLDELPFNYRSSHYYFMVEGVAPTAPVGTPVLTIDRGDGMWKLNWTEVSGANKYYVILKYNDAEIRFAKTSYNYYELEEEIFIILYSEYFEECRANPDESKMEIYVQAAKDTDGMVAYGEKSKVYTATQIKNGGNSGTSGNNNSNNSSGNSSSNNKTEVTTTQNKSTTTKPKATSIKSIKGKKKSIVIKWKKQTSGTKGYQIQYSTNKNFKKNVKSIKIKNNKKTSYTIKKLKSKKKYYVRIRTYKGKNYSAWSKKKSIKTK